MSTFGTVQLVQGIWHIECEPHVRTRLKRVFPRVPQGAGAKLQLLATPENTRELEWFLQRYPMEVSRPDAMLALAQQHRDTESKLGAFLGGHVPPPQITLAEPARHYQLQAAQMLEVVDGYLLADDLGLGKTVSAACAMVLPHSLPAVVVVPAHLPRQWAAAIKRFLPDLSVHVVQKGTPYDLTPKPRGRKASAAQLDLIPKSMPDVIIISYHKLRGWAETLAPIVRYAVFDECQALRSPTTEIYAAAKHLAASAKRRLGLSATPIHNYGSEFFHVIDVIAPGAFGTHNEFLNEWCTSAGSGEKARLKDAREFGSYLRRSGIMLRRTRADVGRELPPLTKIVHEIDADQRELDAIKGNAAELARVILRHNEQFKGQKMLAAGEFDSLMRQATGLAKAPYVAEFVKMMLENGEKVVLFGWHRAVYQVWMDALAEFNPLLYTGSESISQKTEAVEAFKAGRSNLLIMSLRSGAGVDGLQGSCTTVVFGELDWSPSVHTQCIGRVHRDGQDSPCHAYFLVSEGGSDPIMIDVLGVKREQIEGVCNPDAALIERIDIGQNNIQRLAKEFLSRRGQSFELDDLGDQPEHAGIEEPVAG